VFLTTVLATSFFVKSSKASSATIFVNPSTNDVALGDNFTVDIDLDFAENLYCYEIWLSFNNTVLNATTIEYRDYLNEPHFIWYQHVNNTGGYVTLSVSSTYPAAPKTGGSPPPLATINFTATRVAMSQPHLYNTVLADNQSMTIPHENSDSTCDVIPEFPPSTILPIFAVLTSFVAIIVKKKVHKRSRSSGKES